MIENELFEEDLVSVITPVYNCERFIQSCMDSVINQKYKNWEMIIVNDCSTDNTKLIIEDYMKKDCRIKLYNQNENLGAAAARNRAIELSNGRYIAFLDADDLWKAEKLKKQILFMKQNNYGFTFTSYELLRTNSQGKINVIHVPFKINYAQYLKNTIIGCLTVVMDKNIMGDIEVEVGQLEDVLTWMKYLKQGYLAYGLDDNLATYRVTENSVSSNKIKNVVRYYKCLRYEQKLSLIKSLRCQIGYMINATLKRIKYN